MALQQPIKPPRAAKYGKDMNGSGLLVTVIKTLDASETNDDRQKEKLKIEKEFKKTDQKLNDLVAKHDGDLTEIMHLFGQISTQITLSRERIHLVKDNLQGCKSLLRCRREELKKLWIDAVQQKYILQSLEQINDLRKIPSVVQSFILNKQYLQATKTLSEAIQLGNDKLCDVDGVTVLRQDLNVRKNQLYHKLLDELNYRLYHDSTTCELSNFQRTGSSRNGHYSSSEFQRTAVRRSNDRTESNAKFNNIELLKNNFDINQSEMIDNVLDTDCNTTYFLGVICECFVILGKIPESIETIKGQIQPELMNIITKSTQHIVNNQQNLNITSTESNSLRHPLLDLIELVYKQFKVIADAHTLLLKNYSNVMQNHKMNAKLYDMNEFWSQVQVVLQLLITDYLDIQNLVDDELSTHAHFVEQTNDVNNFFNKRKPQIKKSLFKFGKASEIQLNDEISARQNNQTNAIIKEHRRNASDMSGDDVLLSVSGSETKKKEKLAVVCKADASLIRIIYLPLMNIINEIESIIKCTSKLNTFITTYIKEIYLANGHNRNLHQTIQSLSKNHDAWRSIITPEQQKQIGLSRPLLQNTVLVETKITEAKELIKDLPNYSEDLLKSVCSLLKTYRETCQAAYRGIVQPETEDKRIYSVAWLKDEDISRFLKTLPNWTDLKTSSQRTKSSAAANVGRRSLKKMSSYMASEEESPTQIQQRNIREAEMLTSNLGECGISQHEILSDIGVLKELAIMQESMEWFSTKISEFASDLRKPIYNSNITNSNSDLHSPVIIKDGTVKVLTNLALEFDELANTCLLVLHLEVRVQCFHYLRANLLDNSKIDNNFNHGDLTEPDCKVLKLTKVLTEMDEALSSTLHPRKAKYIFEGLAHLASRILIMASNYMETIDQTGVQRMCRNALALQQTLSSITASREIALDHAKNFYEMLYKGPEEILTTVIEKGPQFTEMQYLNALQLACKGNGIIDSNTISNYQQKLSDILGTKPPAAVMV